MNMLNVWMDIYNAMQVKRVGVTMQKSMLHITLHNGSLFFELEGRPDGLHPQQAASYYELYRTQFLLAQQEHTAFRLSREACAQLFQELLLYYARCMAFLKLADHQVQAHKDAVLILRMVHFLRQHSQAELLHHLETFAAFFNELYAFAFAPAPVKKGRKYRIELENFINKTSGHYFQAEPPSRKPTMVFTHFEEN